MVKRNGAFSNISTTFAGSTIRSTLSDTLRQQYSRRSCRVVKGDSVRVLRGEYSGIEGKVEKVNTIRGSLSIEGIQREKVKGGNVKVQIHASNVVITSLNFDDQLRQKNLERSSIPDNSEQHKRHPRKVKAKKKESTI